MRGRGRAEDAPVEKSPAAPLTPEPAAAAAADEVEDEEQVSDLDDVGEGGEPASRRADVYRLDRFLSRPRVWSPSVSMAELRFPGVAAVMVLLAGE